MPEDLPVYFKNNSGVKTGQPFYQPEQKDKFKENVNALFSDELKEKLNNCGASIDVQINGLNDFIVEINCNNQALRFEAEKLVRDWLSL